MRAGSEPRPWKVSDCPSCCASRCACDWLSSHGSGSSSAASRPTSHRHRPRNRAHRRGGGGDQDHDDHDERRPRAARSSPGAEAARTPIATASKLTFPDSPTPQRKEVSVATVDDRSTKRKQRPKKRANKQPKTASHRFCSANRGGKRPPSPPVGDRKSVA